MNTSCVFCEKDFPKGLHKHLHSSECGNEVKLDKDFIGKVRTSIEIVWSQIAYDVEFDTTSISKRNVCAIESCIDADRIVYFDRDFKRQDWLDRAVIAEQTITVACRKFGYEKVLKFLSKEIKIY